MTQTQELIEPIVLDVYGRTLGQEEDARELAKQLAERIETGKFDERGRQYWVLTTCWQWFSGGGTAQGCAQRIEEALKRYDDEA